VLLRHTKNADEAFVGGAWRPTKAIMDWQAGRDDSVEPVSGELARASAPEAFAD